MLYKNYRISLKKAENAEEDNRYCGNWKLLVESNKWIAEVKDENHYRFSYYWDAPSPTYYGASTPKEALEKAKFAIELNNTFRF